MNTFRKPNFLLSTDVSPFFIPLLTYIVKAPNYGTTHREGRQRERWPERLATILWWWVELNTNDSKGLVFFSILIPWVSLYTYLRATCAANFSWIWFKNLIISCWMTSRFFWLQGWPPSSLSCSRTSTASPSPRQKALPASKAKQLCFLPFVYVNVYKRLEIRDL